MAQPFQSLENTTIPEKFEVLVVDLETTDLIRDNCMPHITQLSAAHYGSQKRFNCYVIPKVPISPGAEQITGISMSQDSSGSPVMKVRGKVVPALPWKKALAKFLKWIKGHRWEKVIIVAHNGHDFDFPVLMDSIVKVKKQVDFQARIFELSDSLPLIRKKIPGRKSYALRSLVRDILRTKYAAHDAQADVRVVAKVLKQTSTTLDEIRAEAVPVENFVVLN